MWCSTAWQALARAAGDASEAAEASGLADDADLPLEELLARYGMVLQEPGAGMSDATPAAAARSTAAAEGGAAADQPAAPPAAAAGKSSAMDVAGASRDETAPPPAKRARLAEPGNYPSESADAADPSSAAATEDAGAADAAPSKLGALWREADGEADGGADAAGPAAATRSGGSAADSAAAAEPASADDAGDVDWAVSGGEVRPPGVKLQIAASPDASPDIMLHLVLAYHSQDRRKLHAETIRKSRQLALGPFIGASGLQEEEADDEATLDEEDALAAVAGSDHKACIPAALP